MSVNLLDQVATAVHGHTETIARILEEPTEKVAAVKEIVLTAILRRLSETASSPTGADAIFSATDNFDSGVIENLGAMLNGGQHTALLNKGMGLLESLVGSQDLGALAAAGESAGLSADKTMNLAGLLTPLLLGVLGHTRRAEKLDANSVAELISQPQESLPASHVMEPKMRDPSCSQHQHSPQDAQTQPDTAPDSTTSGQPKGNVFATLLPLLILGVIAFLGYQYVVSNPNRSVSVPEIRIPGFDALGISKSFQEATAGVKSIQTAADASAALANLEKTIAILDEIDLEALAEGDESESVGGFLGELAADLANACESANNVAGVRDVLEPVAGPFLARFDVFQAEATE